MLYAGATDAVTYTLRDSQGNEFYYAHLSAFTPIAAAILADCRYARPVISAVMAAAVPFLPRKALLGIVRNLQSPL